MAQEERMEKHIKVEALVPCKANFSQGFNSDRCGCSSSPNRFNFHGRGGGRFPYSGRNHWGRFCGSFSDDKSWSFEGKLNFKLCCKIDHLSWEYYHVYNHNLPNLHCQEPCSISSWLSYKCWQFTRLHSLTLNCHKSYMVSWFCCLVPHDLWFE